MQIPNITGYRIEEIELPQTGVARRMIRITLRGNGFPMSEIPFEISIGTQKLDALEFLGPGAGVAGLIETVPNEGDQIVFYTPLVEGGTVVAELFQMSKLTDTRIA